MTVHASGFASAVQPVTAQTMITTDTKGLTAGEIRIAVSDGEMPAYRALPQGGKNIPLVLVVQEIFGVHEHIKDVCRRLAKAGYFAVAPELYARQGDVSKLTDIDAVRGIVDKVPDSQVMTDLDAAAAWAIKNGANAAKMAITAYNPVVRSTIATPTFWGPPPGTPSGLPVMLIRPPMPWIIAS